MLAILLIRPGPTEYDQQQRIQGTLDIPLSDEGHQEVARLIDQLRRQRVDVLYAAPCQSALQTGEALAEVLHLKVKTLENLRNVDQGLWQGMLIEDVRTKQPKVYRQWQEWPEKVCPPGGEMLGVAQQRVRQVIAKLKKKHKEGVIGLLVPEPLASVVCNVLRHDQLVDLWNTNGRGRWEMIAVAPDAAVCD